MRKGVIKLKLLYEKSKNIHSQWIKNPIPYEYHHKVLFKFLGLTEIIDLVFIHSNTFLSLTLHNLQK